MMNQALPILRPRPEPPTDPPLDLRATLGALQVHGLVDDAPDFPSHDPLPLDVVAVRGG